MIREGDCIERMREMDTDSIDAIVTDPPYGIGFMGHDWDQPGFVGRRNGTPQPGFGNHSDNRARGSAPRFGGPTGKDNTTHTARGGAMEAGRYDLSQMANRSFQSWCEAWAREALRVLKPGGHMLVFGGTRTYHRLVSGVEDAGFEIRDTIAWLFGSGFPKSRDLGDGWGTALKPGHEPILLARKPCGGPAASCFDEHGTGGLHIAACRIPVEDAQRYQRNHSGDRGHAGTRRPEDRGATDMRMGGGSAAGARWPANVILDPEAAEILDEQSGVLVSGANPTKRGSDKFRDVYGDFAGQEECEPARGIDIGGASRFYYCAKTSRVERNAGLDGFEPRPRPLRWSNGDANPGSFQADGTDRAARNHHPTVKPIDLMRWLLRLITPSGGTVLDPFTGSGTTGCAATLEGLEFVGIEREVEYVEIAEARIDWWRQHPVGTNIAEALDSASRRLKASAAGQMSIEDVA